MLFVECLWHFYGMSFRFVYVGVHVYINVFDSAKVHLVELYVFQYHDVPGKFFNIL